MTTPLERATSRVARHYKRNPDAVRLAMLGSVAVRLESHLLRRLRLSLLPDADVGIEADLWFGPLVESGGVRGVVLNRHVVELLREKLAEDRPLLRRVIALTEAAHTEAPATIRLEERLTALALLNEPNAAQAMDEALRPALRTMEEGGEGARQLAQWAMRALSRAHLRVRESRNARALGLSAALALGGRPILKEMPILQGGFDGLDWLLRGAVSAPRTRIGVELVDSGLAFAAPGGQQPQLELPATSSLMLSLTWKTNGADTERTVEAVPGHTVELDPGVTQVTLRTLSGDEYLLSAVSSLRETAESVADVFISYAHIDNQPATAEGKGWVTQFHDSLAAMLSMRMGRQVKIWRDAKLQGSDVFDEELVDRLAGSSVLVAIVTPRYLASLWCARELKTFCEHAEQRGGVIVGKRSRVIQVLKLPVDDRASLPAVMQDVLGYKFFTDDDGSVLELDPSHGAEIGQRYNIEVSKLAWDIAQLLKTLEADVTAQDGDVLDARGASQTPTKTAVYLAECSDDLRDAREILLRELRQLGYPVLPEYQLPTSEVEYVAAVEHMLARCALSIHLVGPFYGRGPGGPTSKSIGVLQNELAAARARSGGLVRLIWFPAGTVSQQADQQAFIESLHQDAQAQFGADLVTGSLEQFRVVIRDTLDRLERKARGAPDVDAERPASTEQGPPRVYLICVGEDRAAIRPIRDLCFRWGVEVKLPLLEGDPSEVLRAHRLLLKMCDAVLVFYGSGDHSWKARIDAEVRRMLRVRAGTPLRAQYTYLAEPRTPDKQDLIDSMRPGLINGLDGFAESAMVEFLRALTV